MLALDDTFDMIMTANYLFATTCQFAMLTLQSIAYHRHRHASLLWLISASICALVGTFISHLPSLLSLEMSSLTALHFTATVVFVISGILGVYGTFLLFRAYAQLADAAKRTPPDLP